MTDFPAFMTDYRALARDLLYYLGGDVEPWGDAPGEKSSQRQIKDRVYAHGLVEDRVYKPPASSCGDAPHCLFYRLGVRFPWVNRAEFNGWEYMGAKNNITRLTARKCYGTNSLAKKSTDQDHFLTGDILIVNVSTPSSTHAICVLEHRPENGTILTMESGQPGAAIRFKTCVPDGGRWKIGNRHVDSWLSLYDVILAARDDDSGKMLESYETAEDWAKRKGMPLPGTYYSGMRSRVILRAQEKLNTLGFPAGKPDGAFGSGTQKAVEGFQKSAGLSVIGVLDKATQDALGKA